MERLSRRWPYLFIPMIFVVVSALAIGYLLLRRRLPWQRPAPRPTSPVWSSLVTQITGLSEAEAAARQIPVDHEALKKAEQRRFRRDLIRNHLFTFFNLDMIGVAIAMYVLGSTWSAFLSILLLVATFGLNVFQETYTKRKLDKMMEKLQPRVTVIRESRVRSIFLETIVPGDMLVVSIGDRIVVDGEIVGDGQIWVDELAGTAGVVRQLKQAGDNLETGSICAEGQAVYRVTKIEPVNSSMAHGLEASVLPQTPTPLQKLIERIFKILFVLVLIFNGLLFLELSATWLGVAVFDGVLIRDVVSQIFAIAPTSLFLMIAVSYAMGLARIADVGALVYRAETVESLANTSVICFSRSGTLTGQQAALEPIPAPNGYDQLSDTRIKHLLGDCLHSSPTRQPIRLALAQTFPGEHRDAAEIAPFYSAFGWSGITFDYDDLRGTYILGDGDLLKPFLATDQVNEKAQEKDEDTTETAQSNQWGWPKWLRRSRPLDENGSDPENSEEVPDDPGSKGAHHDVVRQIMARHNLANDLQTPEPDRLRAVQEADDQTGFRQQWTGRFRRWFAPQSVEEIAETPDQDAEKISLLFAYLPEVAPLHNDTGMPQLPQQLIPLGRIQLADTIRPEAVEVVQAFVKAGVKIKILSADAPDHVATTVKQAHLSEQENPRIISGPDLHVMNSDTFARTIQAQDFYAHLTPRQQEAIVRGLRSQGEYVAVAGSEVNDIPAMRQANLSITSQSGSQATMTVADIVLLDTSLTVLPNVLYRGQQIVNGLLDLFKLYLTHIASHLLLFSTVIFMLSLPAPYSSTQASIISFFGITVPAILLPFWASIGRVPEKSISRQLIHFVLPAALTTALLAISIYAWYVQLTSDIEYARLVVTHALVAAALLRVIFVKPPTPAWVGGNPLCGDWRPVWMTVIAGLIYVVFVAITAAVPTFQGWFDLDALKQPQDYLFIIVAVGLWAIVTRTLWRLLLRYGKWAIFIIPPNL